MVTRGCDSTSSSRFFANTQKFVPSSKKQKKGADGDKKNSRFSQGPRSHSDRIFRNSES